ncbi:uncharacterized protein LOC111518606 [Drosophila willistoni]|uniref:uncharacterized protein LOC111518606 n=1 Tax=Drosophila willistoni TaxID=7260 RepID=UPI001F072674|nr:uncharacterized protein LOC111518606 [Drosophila willistoni]XP_046866511.1 uncharacterized protein LOC111518606 [Drosophila willistoni]XP_046866512.1 uncharacterized protein LOC111518606 [Drosophila willistoni]
MAEKIKLFSFRPFKLSQIHLLHLVEYNPDTQKLETPKTIGFYRQPNISDYPLNLAKGYENYIHGDWAKHSTSPHDIVLHYLMQAKNPKLQLEQTDFCINRKTLIIIIELFLNASQKRKVYERKEKNVVAVRFNGCIFLNYPNLEYQSKTLRSTYAFKARQYLFSDVPGSIPNTDDPLNANKRLFGTFSAKLGNLSLLYSAEIAGVENTEPLGDLNDPEVLKQCRLASVKVFSNPDNRNRQWRTNWRNTHWLIQAHLANIKQQRVAIFDKNGLVHEPIDADGRNQLDRLNNFDLTECSQFLHRFLMEIANIIGDADCPHTIYEFSVEEWSLFFNGKKHKTNSTLTEEFIQFASRI